MSNPVTMQEVIDEQNEGMEEKLRADAAAGKVYYRQSFKNFLDGKGEGITEISAQQALEEFRQNRPGLYNSRVERNNSGTSIGKEIVDCVRFGIDCLRGLLWRKKK